LIFGLKTGATSGLFQGFWMILVFWSMNLSYSPHQSYPSGNQDWAVQAAALSKNPFLEIAGLKKRVGYAWYFGYFEWVR